mmetsp:Transcript_52206/g.60960  ORF Transcript_52206/g.60960 Transcript_52206/m.60960 type:complete len:84 (+) Transcript_52206:190-441(+)
MLWNGHFPVLNQTAAMVIPTWIPVNSTVIFQFQVIPMKMPVSKVDTESSMSNNVRSVVTSFEYLTTAGELMQQYSCTFPKPYL